MEAQDGRRWYVVQTYSGYENKVKANLEQRIKSMGLEKNIFNVLVPVEERVLLKEGKSRKISRKLYPSYVLVEMLLDEQSWYVVRHTPGVTGFVGAGSHPLPLSEREVRDLMARIGPEQGKPKVEINLKVGDIVRLKDEAFGKESRTPRTGSVVEIFSEKGRVKVMVTSDAGLEIPFDLDYQDLEKIG